MCKKPLTDKVISQTRENGCIKGDCIVPLPCGNKHPPKTNDGFCVRFNNGVKRNAIIKKRLGGKMSKEIPERIKKICRQCPDIDCPFNICYYPHKERGIY